MIRGISGNLLPLQFIEHQLSRLDSPIAHDRFRRWWARIEASCGPASGIRALADLIALPLCAELGFSASAAEFGSRHAMFQLRARYQSLPQSAGLIVAPWANRSPGIWRDAVDHARRLDAAWCLIAAPPFVQIV